MYYLNSRYYDPEIGRFLNSDDVNILAQAKEFINGLNIYAYCLNNPVNEVDESGYIVGWLLGIIIGAIVGSVVGGTLFNYLSNLLFGKSINIDNIIKKAFMIKYHLR